jgi:hypothetical protein
VTAAGRRHLKQETANWRRLTQAIGAILQVPQQDLP